MQARSMKVYLSALLFSGVLASALTIVEHAYGVHSTPAIWMAVACLPGTVFGVWAAVLTRQNDFIFYLTTVLANSALYFILAKGFTWLNHKLTKPDSAQ